MASLIHKAHTQCPSLTHTQGFYDRKKLWWKEIDDTTLCAACAPPGGGRQEMTPRFVRHFTLLCVPLPSETVRGCAHATRSPLHLHSSAITITHMTLLPPQSPHTEREGRRGRACNEFAAWAGRLAC